MRRMASRRRLAVLPLMVLAACATAIPSPTPRPDCPDAAPTAASAADIIAETSALEVRTNKGSFTILLEPDSAPIAVANLVTLAHCGFYDGISFHRVIAEFVAQAGDPQTKGNHEPFDGVGRGGPGYQFTVELPPGSTAYPQYTVAMANALQFDPATGEILSGLDTNGSQFFVMLADADFLPPYYSLLGRVVAGQDVVDAIGQVPTTGNSEPADVPLDPVIIETIVDTEPPEGA
jgi:peptidyl-prolyl cis-trans isomerase B (cyclophilin B)